MQATRMRYCIMVPKVCKKGRAKMIVTLLQATPHADIFIADIASICYGRKAASNPQALITRLLECGHTSVLEHAVFTFRVENISRVCSHQLVRHRIASYTQRSQRYCDEQHQMFYQDFDEASLAAVQRSCDDSFMLYNTLVQQGIPKEKARMVLPQGTFTDIVVTMNARALLNFMGERLCLRAQDEIRVLALQMRQCVAKTAPILASRMVAKCETCKESCPRKV